MILWLVMNDVFGDHHVISYRPHVTVAFIAKQLAFAEEDKCVEWLTGFEGLVYTAEAGGKAMAVPTITALLDCKNSAAAVNF